MALDLVYQDKLRTCLREEGVLWCEECIMVLDQRLLPQEEVFLTFTRAWEVALAIKVGIIVEAKTIIKSCLAALYLAAQKKMSMHNNDSDELHWHNLKEEFSVLTHSITADSETLLQFRNLYQSMQEETHEVSKTVLMVLQSQIEALLIVPSATAL